MHNNMANTKSVTLRDFMWIKKPEPITVNIKIQDCIAEPYDDVLQDVLRHGHTHYIFPGGRGSLKSSFVSEAIPLIMIDHPDVNALCLRKVGNTVQNSIFAQIIWGIYKLGLEDLFYIPKTYSSDIVLKRTGQRIFFAGLDDAGKIKSIKPKKGYIGITWFEELDQFEGEEEIRKTTQSTMRGGNVFWDFRSFNPPISKNNWANEYAERCEITPKLQATSMVMRSDYTQMPAEWLGPQFIEEAELLKETNPRAYEHEYLGHAIGTGGDVFPNACDLDMTKLVDVYDYYGNSIRKVPLYETFDKLYHGIDWGFAIDPTRYVKLHFDPDQRDIYIFDEYNTVKSRIQNIYHDLYEDKKLLTNSDLLAADPGGGGLFAIADFKAFGAFIRPAEKGPDSVNYGIKWLQGMNHIYIDKRRCPYTWKEFSTYEYEQDKEGNFISAYPDENNHSIDAVRYALEKYWKRKGN